MYASWDENYLHLAIYAADYTDPRMYLGNVIPESERMLWTINLGADQKPIQIRLGDGGKPKVIGDENIEMKSLEQSTRFTVILKIPAPRFGKKNFGKGESLSLVSNLVSHSNAEKMNWTQPLKFGE
jgi:hypothetical protein